MLADYIGQRLREYYPSSKKLTPTLIAELAAFFEKAGDEIGFDAALAKYREGYNGRYCPDVTELRQFAKFTRRDDRERIVMGWSTAHPDYCVACQYWAKAQYVNFATLSIAAVAGKPYSFPLGRWQQILEHAKQMDAEREQRMGKQPMNNTHFAKHFYNNGKES